MLGVVLWIFDNLLWPEAPDVPHIRLPRAASLNSEGFEEVRVAQAPTNKSVTPVEMAATPWALPEAAQVYVLPPASANSCLPEFIPVRRGVNVSVVCHHRADRSLVFLKNSSDVGRRHGTNQSGRMVHAQAERGKNKIPYIHHVSCHVAVVSVCYLLSPFLAFTCSQLPPPLHLADSTQDFNITF